MTKQKTNAFHKTNVFAKTKNERVYVADVGDVGSSVVMGGREHVTDQKNHVF